MVRLFNHQILKYYLFLKIYHLSNNTILISITENKSYRRGVIFMLYSTSLETAKIGNTLQLLDHENHIKFLKNHKRDPSRYRPDICHHALLSILESPLNLVKTQFICLLFKPITHFIKNNCLLQSGNIRSIYLQTITNLLIVINPRINLPRTYHKFCEIMIRLMRNGSLRQINSHDKLLKVIKGPVSNHLPKKSLRIGLSPLAPNLVNLECLIETVPKQIPLVFLVTVNENHRIPVSPDHWIAVSSYPLNIVSLLNKIVNTIENRWCIV
eukprot:gnl/TRDRNA2_/TRDRNA2_177966_c2_seq5.p1 gnl/TRDRNA2_/TRDRNA2_177966_c2~~gnl/TRDRNA2_/TRDRNA2_177966_c2_seq5.p1  ORF type:complete len:269 (+),score=-43.06 gnl/TRDRNA2_/TRDRNA2_177966_c2_seq5:22-828(+)